jgi:hypothetical protein
MQLRTLTYFCDTDFPVQAKRLAAAGETLAGLKRALEEAGYVVQTTRLAAPPLSATLTGEAANVLAYARQLEEAAFVNDIHWSTIGPVSPDDPREFFDALPAVVAETDNVFTSALVADAAHGVSVAAIRAAAEVIVRNAAIGEGLGNLRFAALANVPAGAPFLPAAYHGGGPPSVAIGVEAAELAVTACAEAATLAEARAALTERIETQAVAVTEIAQKALGRRARFGGLDFSFAPYPTAARSLGTALERLAGMLVGEHGSVAAAAVLAEALDRARFQRAGFNGLFFPVLEDAVLAARAGEGVLTVKDLLLFSAVCGSGLDTVPLPGDIAADLLAALLLDVAALALRLNKPLTARLMPIPGKAAGDAVSFDFEFFAPSRVLALAPAQPGGLVGGTNAFPLGPPQPLIASNQKRF